MRATEGKKEASKKKDKNNSYIYLPSANVAVK
jgi:hypothetical protein